jgi:hypothetical protein
MLAVFIFDKPAGLDNTTFGPISPGARWWQFCYVIYTGMQSLSHMYKTKVSVSYL